MKKRDNPFTQIQDIFGKDSNTEIDFRQISRFFYDQLIDAFIFYSCEHPVNWTDFKNEDSRLKLLADKFTISKVNDALLLQFNYGKKSITGLSLGKFFGKQFLENREAFLNLLNFGEY